MESFIEFIEKIDEASSKGELFTVEDIIKAISHNLFVGISIYILVKDDIKELSSSLSVIKTINENNEKIIQFNSTDELRRYLKEIDSWPILEKINRYIIQNEDYPIYLIAENYQADDIDNLEELFFCVSDIVIGTLNYQNISRDYTNIKISNLKKELNVNYDINRLCDFLHRVEKIEIGHSLVSPKKEISEIYSKFEVPIDYRNVAYIPYFNESIFTGKPISFWEDVSKKYIVIIPVIRKAQEARFTRNVIVIWSGNRINFYTVNNIIEIVDYFLNKQLINTKLTSLVDIQNEVIKDFNSKGYDNKDKLLEVFKLFTKRCLKQIIDTTFAYSAVVRLYNPIYKSLTRFSSECNQWGDWDGCEIDRANESIPLKRYKQSVNAFAFVMAGSLKQRHEPYVYIANFKSKIPPKYKEFGLTNILIFRESSNSEICFPLFIGDVPFGTLNIESPISNAFIGDIPYLSAIKQSIESFYDINIKANDANWLAERSPVYTNVHEIKQLLRKNTNSKIAFTAEQTEILEKLIKLEDKIPLTEYIDVKLLRNDIEEFLQKNIDIITYQKNIDNLFYWHIENSIFIENTKYEKIKLIIINLLENIINHSYIDKDKIDLSIDQLDLHSDFSNLQIKVRTYGVFDNESFTHLTYSPVLKKDTYHYGMFLVGMLSRKLGGSCYIERKEEKNIKLTIIEILIPLKK